MCSYLVSFVLPYPPRGRKSQSVLEIYHIFEITSPGRREDDFHDTRVEGEYVQGEKRRSLEKNNIVSTIGNSRLAEI